MPCLEGRGSKSPYYPCWRVTARHSCGKACHFCSGRWLVKSRSLRKGSHVPWCGTQVDMLRSMLMDPCCRLIGCLITRQFRRRSRIADTPTVLLGLPHKPPCGIPDSESCWQDGWGHKKQQQQGSSCSSRQCAALRGSKCWLTHSKLGRHTADCIG